MIEAVTIEGVRGLQRLQGGGVGRGNLVICKNECGKTRLRAALAIAESAEGAPHCALFLQGLRRSREAASDFVRFWRPLFWNHDAERGFSVRLRGSRERAMCIEFRKAEARPMMLAAQGT